MIERDGGVWWVSCDGCSDSHDTGVEDSEPFQAAVDEVKRLGWSLVELDGEYQHICVSCQEDMQGGGW